MDKVWGESKTHSEAVICCYWNSSTFGSIQLNTKNWIILLASIFVCGFHTSLNRVWCSSTSASTTYDDSMLIFGDKTRSIMLRNSMNSCHPSWSSGTLFPIIWGRKRMRHQVWLAVCCILSAVRWTDGLFEASVLLLISSASNCS